MIPPVPADLSATGHANATTDITCPTMVVTVPQKAHAGVAVHVSLSQYTVQTVAGNHPAKTAQTACIRMALSLQ